ncbi:U5-snRNA binding site 2 of PrP8-domain-containing protein, partial [Pisolithus marmoratus]
YHEAVIHTNELLDALVKAKNRIQTCVKIRLNNKMPSCFPLVIFYIVKELDSLSMLSIGHVLIPQSDLRWLKQLTLGVSIHHHSYKPATNEYLGGQPIPNLYHYLQPWEAEFLDPVHVWSEYSMKWKEVNTQIHHLTLEDLGDSWD